MQDPHLALQTLCNRSVVDVARRAPVTTRTNALAGRRPDPLHVIVNAVGIRAADRPDLLACHRNAVAANIAQEEDPSADVQTERKRISGNQVETRPDAKAAAAAVYTVTGEARPPVCVTQMNIAMQASEEILPSM